MADHPTRTAGGVCSGRQLHAQRTQPQRLQPNRSGQQHEKANPLLPLHTCQILQLTTSADLVGQPAPSCLDAAEQQHHPPPGGESEQVKQDV